MSLRVTRSTISIARKIRVLREISAAGQIRRWLRILPVHGASNKIFDVQRTVFCLFFFILRLRKRDFMARVDFARASD